MWVFFYVNCLFMGNGHATNCMATPNGTHYRTEKECRKNETGKSQHEYIEKDRLIIVKKEFVQGVCINLKTEKVTKEIYKIIKE